MAEEVVIRVRDLACPPEIEPWVWDGLIEDLGDLVVARGTGEERAVRFTCGRPECSKVHYRSATVLTYCKDAIRQVVERIQGGGDECDSETWKGDEITFMDPDFWKKG